MNNDNKPNTEEAPEKILRAICPYCRAVLCSYADVLDEMERELRSWDRRFDGPERVARNLFLVLVEMLCAKALPESRKKKKTVARIVHDQ